MAGAVAIILIASRDTSNTKNILALETLHHFQKNVFLFRQKLLRGLGSLFTRVQLICDRFLYVVRNGLKLEEEI
jgi:hypothetical protein